jgi:hypothetical protein
VDHAYVRKTPETPWRTAAIVAAAVAAVELFMLIVVGVVLGAKLVSNHAEKAVTTIAAKSAAPTAATLTTTATGNDKKASSPVVARLPRNRTSVIVLNGNGVSGAAAITADRVRSFHYIVAATGNAPRSDFNRSVVMYRSGFKGEAIRLGRDLHVRRVVPLDGITRHDLQGAHLALIIGG